MLNCTKCGYDNELGRIFCHSCGAKLDLSGIKSPSQGGAKLKKKSDAGSKLLGRVIAIVILVALIAAIFLAAQVPSVRPVSTTNHDLLSADKKRFDLDQISARTTPQQISITEAELNAFIDTLGFKKSDGKGLLVTPTNLQIELGDGVAKAIFLGKLSVGSLFEKRLYLSLTGTPVIEDSHFVFKPVSGAVGALPIHPWLLEQTGILDHYFEQLFASQAHEKQILDSLKSISVTPQEVVLNYEPPATTH